MRAALLALLLLASCSSPDPNLYTIAPVTGATLAGAPATIAVRDVYLARYLERREIVRSSEDYRLAVMQNDWWGEPLGALLGRVLVAELGQRLPGSSVLADGGAVSVVPEATLEINLQRLDQDAGGNLILQAQAAVSRSGRTAPALRSFRFSVTPAEPGIRGTVSAISTAVGQLADGLAAMLAAPAPRR